MKPIVLYHANCADGFTAAWVAHRKLGDEAEYLPVQYGEPPPDVTGRIRVYILDFSYPLNVLIKMGMKVDECGTITVIDHHQTAKHELEPLLDPFNRQHSRINCTFDMDKSGGRLTWEHFFPNEQPPPIVLYTEDRDLWRWALTDSKAISAAIRSWEMTFDRWEYLNGVLELEPVSDGLIVEGIAILRVQDQMVRAICQTAREIELDGHKILAANTPVLISEVAGQLAKGRPFGASWFVCSDGRKQWSLRSAPEGIDVAVIAKRHGGGGHKHAAGFEEQS